MNTPEPQDPPAPNIDRAGRRWHIDRIDTEPLSEVQHQHAVAILADLITTWVLNRFDSPGYHTRNAA
ncbi:hypothetical protein D5S18_17065 [Nocardia panacis]|uniref:Uncharacterized protein n=1 Tax=Nocardia panacis TaxID=2340916 RepID=A0A3A4KGH4_9NOCA|nr:hypothetical protein [Nocardia panacis]RJO75088.1 hypothetical protein D5S18_17065 [Nocardia panacis]